MHRLFLVHPNPRCRARTAGVVTALAAALAGLVAAPSVRAAASVAPVHAAAVAATTNVGFQVVGNVIEDGNGQPWFAHGVDRPSLEWACAGQHADGGPAGIPASDFLAMASWHANTVRLALNQDYWLSSMGTPVAAAESCPGYISTVRSVIASAEAAGLVVILDLHWSDAGNPLSTSVGQQCMADGDSLVFWRSVAASFESDTQVMFELYNEPHDISWPVWRDGGTLTCNGVTYAATGMQQMVDAVRGSGAHNVVIVGGVGWAYDLSGVVGAGPLTGGNVAYATHPYEGSQGYSVAEWDRAFGALATHAPVIATEFGTNTCSVDAYDSDILAYFRSHGISYTMWAWYAGGCAFPAVISDAAGSCFLGGCTTKADLAAYATGAQQPTVQAYVPFASPPAPTPAAPGHYVSLSPSRVLDTRPAPDGPIGRCPTACTSLGGGQAVDVQVTGANGVPDTGVTAVVLNVTATNPTASSYLTVYPAGTPRPTASNLNVVAGQTVANLVQVAVGSGGDVSIFNLAGSVDVVADVEGYVAPAASTAGLFNALTPARLCDTRPASAASPVNQCSGQALGPGSTRTVHVLGNQGVPTMGVSGAVVNLTVTDPSASSYLTVSAPPNPRPLASNLNFLPGQTVANRVVVPVSPAGDITVFNLSGWVDVVVDLAGWYTDPTSATGALDNPLAPARVCDSRAASAASPANQCSSSRLAPGGTLTITVAGLGGIPVMGAGSPRAVVLNVTVTGTTAAGFLTAYPAGLSRPLASDLNWAAGASAANLVIVAVGPEGTVSLYNSAGGTDVVVDVAGWY